MKHSTLSILLLILTAVSIVHHVMPFLFTYKLTLPIFFTYRNSHRVTRLYSVKRRPERQSEWEIRKKNRNTVQKDTSRVEIADSMALLETNPSLGDKITGLVIERLGGCLLVEVANSSITDNVICYQRSSLCDTQIVVGDIVDLYLTDNSASMAISADQHLNESLNNVESIHYSDGIIPIPNHNEEDDMMNNYNTNENISAVVTLPPKKSTTPSQGVVIHHHTRRSLLQRPSPVSSSSSSNFKYKAIAANIDQIIAVTAILPVVPKDSIDRVLVAANEYNIDALIVVNKFDLEGSIALYESLQYYESIGYRILKVSVTTGEGINELKAAIRGKSTVFVGQSGIGKSSLVNSLLPLNSNYQAKVGDLVKSVNLGSHTTSSARLFHLSDEDKGCIIDSPGIREIGLWHLSEDSIKAGFREIADLSVQCKFRNCKHSPDTLGCAVQQGIVSGKVHPDRLESYFKFLK